MTAALAMHGNTAATFPVHFFGNRRPYRNVMILAGAGQGNRGGASHRVITPVTINTVLTRGPKRHFVRSNMSGSARRRSTTCIETPSRCLATGPVGPAHTHPSVSDSEAR